MSKIRNQHLLWEILDFLDMRKVLQVITENKSLHEIRHISPDERSLLVRIYDTPLAPLHYTCRFSKNSSHINGFLYNKLKDYKALIREQAASIDEEKFNKNFENYLTRLNPNFVCMLDPNDAEGLALARRINNLNYGLFLDYAPNNAKVDLSGINLTYFADNLEKLTPEIRNDILDQLANCANLDTLRITFPSEYDPQKFLNLPKNLRKLQLVNNWKSGDELIKALNACAGFQNIESLTIYTFQKCVESNLIDNLRNALSNFKKVKSLYIRQSIQEVVPYEKFRDIFSPFMNTLEKIKFDLDIFDGKQNPITFQDFPNLKKVIIKNNKPNQSIYELGRIPYVQLRYAKAALHRGSIEGITPTQQGYHIVFDKEGFEETEYSKIYNALGSDVLRYLSVRAINTGIPGFFENMSQANKIEVLELTSILGDWKLENILSKTTKLRSLTLIGLGNPVPEHCTDISQTKVVFPENNEFSTLQELNLRKSLITNAKNMLSYAKNIRNLSWTDLTMNKEDFQYFCENIRNLQNLETLFFGKFNVPDANEDEKNAALDNFFKGLTLIKTIKNIEFQSDFRIDLGFLKILKKHLAYIKGLKRLKISVLETGNGFDARKILLQSTAMLHELKELKLIMFDS
ncbi:MAG: hypothetical protein MJ252_19825 [archaeon]|nr:hypothetical protein [archaeon]